MSDSKVASTSEKIVRETLGPRKSSVSGKIPETLYTMAKDLIDGQTYRTMNDVVEAALFHLVGLSGVQNERRESNNGM